MLITTTSETDNSKLTACITMLIAYGTPIKLTVHAWSVRDNPDYTSTAQHRGEERRGNKPLKLMDNLNDPETT